MGFLIPKNKLKIHFNVTVPYDTQPGIKGDILTATAIAA